MLNDYLRTRKYLRLQLFLSSDKSTKAKVLGRTAAWTTELKTDCLGERSSQVNEHTKIKLYFRDKETKNNPQKEQKPLRVRELTKPG